MAILTVYPDPSSGATTVDGIVERYIAGSTESFATLRASSATLANTVYQESSKACSRLGASSTTNSYGTLSRSIFTFDTSPLTSSANISSATLYIYGNGDGSGSSFGGSATITSVTLAANNNIATGDYASANYGSTSFGSIAFSSMSGGLGDENAFTINAAGIANINKTGITAWSIRNSFDVSNTEPTWVNGGADYCGGCFVDNTVSSTLHPKLVITYTTGGATTVAFKPRITFYD